MTRVLSRQDVDFLLYDWLGADRLAEREHYAEHDRETFDATLDLAEKIAEDVFAPINQLLDAQEPTMGADGRVEQPEELAKALRIYADSGLTASGFGHDHGGAQLPYVVRAAASTFLGAGSVGAYAYPALSLGNASLLVAHGSAEQVAKYALPQIESRWFGTMCLSEPDAGSSLGDLTTTAVPQDDGTYRLTGSKMWISGGDHELTDNIVHLVLARMPGAPVGVKGISLFVVPKFLVDDDGNLGERNDVALVGLNHKMGYRGTTNTLLSFGGGSFEPAGRPGAVGELVGEVGRGLAVMFHMMNEARIGVGSGAVALGYNGYLRALDYARTRTQGRPLAQRDPATPPVPIIDHPDVRRMLLTQKAYVEGGLALILYCARLVDEAATGETAEVREEASGLLDLLTPVAKSWPSQWCLKANDLAIQVHGGYGYTRDFPVEQLYRDNRLNPIHEGTHGIQALDLLGRKVPQRDGANLGELATRINDTVTRGTALGGAVAEHATTLAASLEDVLTTTQSLLLGGDIEAAMANASYYLESVGHLVVAWLWVEQEIAAHDRAGAFFDGKRSAAHYFLTYELPLVSTWLGILATGDRTTVDLDPDTL